VIGSNYDHKGLVAAFAASQLEHNLGKVSAGELAELMLSKTV